VPHLGRDKGKAIFLNRSRIKLQDDWDAVAEEALHDSRLQGRTYQRCRGHDPTAILRE